MQSRSTLAPGLRPAHAALVLVGLMVSCGSDAPLVLPDAAPLEVPAGPGAAEPSVASWGDRLLLSWIEPDSAGHMLRFAAWNGTAWSPPGVVARGAGWFVNWADFPSVLALDEHTLVSHWLQRSARSGYAYDVLLTRSTDAGATWSEPIRPHRDGTLSEHGFVSLVPAPNGAGIVWLDGRRFAGPNPTKEMTVRFATWDAAGSLSDDVALDERACDCCQTAAAMTEAGPIVAYRDRTAEEIRDIAVTRLVAGAWTEPRPLHQDGWHIDACPVNGPQADAAGRDVAIAWFTAANDSPRVQVTFSRDAGASFGTPVRIDDGNPLGRVDVLLTEEGSALVLWLERVGDGAEVRARLVRQARAGASRVIARTTAQRPAGFPRMARTGNRVLIAWTLPGDTSRVRAATLELPR